VKAASETNADVGDRANDSCASTAARLRAKVVGEGANLGFTQAGRIEFALWAAASTPTPSTTRPGSIRSDHEVNIKILLAGLPSAVGDVLKASSATRCWPR
jgi:glutamate dehydrogenase